MHSIEIYLCDECDRLATNFAIDMRRTDKPGDEWEAFEPVGEIKHGCFLHVAKSEVRDA